MSNSATFSCLFYSIIQLLTFSRTPDVILDLHTAAFHKLELFGFMNDYLFKKSLYLIVTNKQLLSEIDFRYKSKVLILEDSIFDLPETNVRNKIDTSQLPHNIFDYNCENYFKIGIICSFAEDEPISEIIASTKLVPNIKFFMSGDYSRIIVIYQMNLLLTIYIIRDF
jgi:hypothetical protein